MKPKWGIKKMSVLVTLVLMLSGITSIASGEDSLNLNGRLLTEQEMVDTRGGLSLPNGGFVTFSMEYFRLNTVINDALNVPEGMTSFNGLKQYASIDENGIKFKSEILQFFNGEGVAEGLFDPSVMNDISDPDRIGGAGGPTFINENVIGNSFTNFYGLSNANIISGNNNVGSIVNLFNIRVDFHNAKDFGGFNPQSMVLH